jgi:hypothetical protein
MPSPIRFVFGVHLHQPVGNFDSVFEQHLVEVYQPFLERLDERDVLPVVLHLSGPLLEWLERRGSGYLDLVGNLVARGKLELLLAGMYEPILASLPREDRLEQIAWMREALKARFGVEATGLWLTERVWEPELAADLAAAGVEYALVDDRHFLVTGFAAEDLHVPYTTESDGRRLTLFPIDERLRYLVPFRSPGETAAYLRDLAARKRPLAILADDGEKFGGWPGTREWVYEKGWLDDFLATLAALVDGGEVLLTTFAEARAAVPSGGLAYLPTASYREMEEWSLPAAQARRLAALERAIGEERLRGAEGPLIRGAHWRNFLVKYPEANRMHKKMFALSRLVRQAGNPVEARRAIGRSQCNDAYWHGVFGGLYLPHLRDAVWAELARAEGFLRRGEAPAWEQLDFDGDGRVELWIHHATFSAILGLERGGVIEELTVFAHRINYANVLTRRREVYHDVAPEGGYIGAREAGGAPSIHDLESGMRPDRLPPVDPEERALLSERVLGPEVDSGMHARGDYDPDWSIRETQPQMEITGDDRGVTVTFRVIDLGVSIVEKTYRFEAGGTLEAHYRWRPEAFDPGTFFSPELSVNGPLETTCTPATEVWSYDIATVAKSEKGLEATVQGRALSPRWPIGLGAGEIRVVPKGRVLSAEC